MMTDDEHRKVTVEKKASGSGISQKTLKDQLLERASKSPGDSLAERMENTDYSSLTELIGESGLSRFTQLQRAAIQFAEQRGEIYRSSIALQLVDETNAGRGIDALPVSEAYAGKLIDIARAMVRKWLDGDEGDPIVHGVVGDFPPKIIDEYQRKAGEYLATIDGRYSRLLRLINNLAHHNDPGELFFQYVDDVLENEAGNVGNEYRDPLARLLFKASQRLIERCIKTAENEPEHGPWWWPEDGMLWLDAVAIDWLDDEGCDGWNTDADGARKKARKRWHRYHRSTAPEVGPELLIMWLDTDESIPWKLQPVESICEHLWRTELRPKWEARDLSQSLYVVRQSGDCYAKTPKPGGSISWALDGPGNVVHVDDDQYTDAPGITRYIPRSAPVMPKGRRPHQQRLDAGLYDDDEEIPLAVRTVGDVDAVLGTIEAKLALAMLITGERGMVADELRNLTEHLNPSKPRVRKRDDIRTAKALRRLRRLGLVRPDDTDIQLFSVQAPATDVRRDMEVSWCYTSHFRKLLAQLSNMDGPIKSLNGQFLVNYSAIMAFNGNEGIPLRHYVTACAMWNDANDPATRQFSADQLPRLDRETWAAKTNTLSQGAVDYLAEGRKGGNRRIASRDRRKAIETLEDLEARGLIRLEGDVDSFKVIPTDDHLEAYEKWRTGGPRPKGDD